MTSGTDGFRFVDQPSHYGDSEARVVRIPAGLTSKQAVLEAYVRQLELPSYFGWNWDALEECLHDLSWLSDDRPVEFVHEALPLRKGSAGRRTYVRLLHDVVGATAARGRALSAIFAVRLQDEIDSLVAGDDEAEAG